MHFVKYIYCFNKSQNGRFRR